METVNEIKRGRTLAACTPNEWPSINGESPGAVERRQALRPADGRATSCRVARAREVRPARYTPLDPAAPTDGADDAEHCAMRRPGAKRRRATSRFT